MGWERYVLAAGPILIVEVAVIQTIATFDSQLLAFLDAFKDWQALIAALVAIAGIGWQVARQGDLSREQIRHNIDLAHAQERLKQISVVRAIYPALNQAILNVNHNIGVLEVAESSSAYSFYDMLVANCWDETEIELLTTYETRFGELDGATTALWAFLKGCHRIDRRITESKRESESPRGHEAVETQMRLDQAILQNALLFGDMAQRALVRRYPEAIQNNPKEEDAALFKELGKKIARDMLKLLSSNS